MTCQAIVPVIVVLSMDGIETHHVYYMVAVTEGSHDPSDDTSSHDTTADEKLRELYNCSFLVDDPSPAQLEGVTCCLCSYYFSRSIVFYFYQMFSIAHPYMAKEAIQGKMPGQLSLHANQVVQVAPIFMLQFYPSY